MALSKRALNRSTLLRQGLLERRPTSVPDTVRNVVGLQAQEPASPFLALWNRIAGFDPEDLAAAFAAHEVVKAPLMRVTLHAVASSDYPIFHQAMLPTLRGARLWDKRFGQTGLSIEEADALADHVVELLDEPLGKGSIEDSLAERLGAPPNQYLWWAMRTYAPLIHAPGDHPWAFPHSPSYRRAPSTTDRPDTATARRLLLHRYLKAFGPATVEDFCRFAAIARTSVRELVAGMDDLVRVDGSDRGLLDAPDAPPPNADAAAPPRLLAMWESILLGYHDRSRVMPEEYRKIVIRSNGDTLPTVLVDGFVAGVWRLVEDGIELSAFRELDRKAWEALADEAASLLALVADRDPKLYGRYHRWWASIDAEQVRVLPG